MEKFSITERGYNPEEVNQFLDQIIRKFEEMVKEISEKNDMISVLKKERVELIKNSNNELLEQENKRLKEKLENYVRMEETLNRAILMAQKTSDQMKASASEQAETIVNEARNNANRIVNEALLKAEKTRYETDMLRRNLVVFKRRLRGVLETQMELVDDIEKIEINY